MSDGQSKLWDMIGSARVCMLVDRFGTGLRARPMAPMAEREASAIWFVTDESSGKVDEIERNSEVCITVSDGNDHASITGEAAFVDDPAKLRDLWNVALDAWFPDGPDGGSAHLMRVTPRLGEYWDGPSTLVAGLKMAAAAITDKRPDMGTNVKVSF